MAEKLRNIALDLGTVSEIATAALGQGVTPIVRVPGKEHHHASRVLDNGAQGVMVPHVTSTRMGGVSNNELMAKYINLGAQFLLGGADQGFIINGGKARTSYLRTVNGK